MFSGIVETTGTIQDLEYNQQCIHMSIISEMMLSDLGIGDSIAVNGVCLTVTTVCHPSFKLTVVPETMRCTNLGSLTKGSRVNLERSITLSDRISGHYLQGHVDSACEIIDLTNDGNDAWIVKINIARELGKYIVRKGYIAIDGMSITVIDITDDYFTITFIPHTRKASIANDYRVGTTVNIEVDIIGRYVEKLLARQS